MPTIKLETAIGAPIERVFDLARSIDLHRTTMSSYGEKAVAGVTKGLINLGETVTWEAKHLGLRQRLTSKITAFDRPAHFHDSMLRGAFARFEHDHFFAAGEAGTLMTDVVEYASPLGILGTLADRLFLEKYVTRMLVERNRLIKEIAESADNWKKFVA